jgi:hypothetical protein
MGMFVGDEGLLFRRIQLVPRGLRDEDNRFEDARCEGEAI